MCCLKHKTTTTSENTSDNTDDDIDEIYINVSHPLEGIVAMDSKGGIGKNGVLPWKIREEMELFKKMTTGHILLMGSSTFESFRNKPLPNRLNIVLTNNIEKYSKLEKYNNLLFVNDTNIYNKLLYDKNILNRYPFLNLDYKVFVIGGAGIYRILIPECSSVWVSVIDRKYDCDVSFPCCELINDKKKYTNDIYKNYEEFTVYKYTKRKTK